MSECFIFPVILKSFIKHNLPIKYILAEVPGIAPRFLETIEQKISDLKNGIGKKKFEFGKK